MTGAKTAPISDAIMQGVLRATQAAAAAALGWVGRGDKEAADHAAVEAMRAVFSRLPMAGEIVIGEGERDEAPMLFIGEKVGTGEGMAIDIAVDPLEGTTLTAKAMPNALAVAAAAPKGCLLNAPDVYMEKIAAGGDIPAGIIALDRPPGEMVREIAKAKKLPPEQIKICLLDRPRHDETIASLRESGAGIVLISDGDVAAALHTASPPSGIDLYMGIGGAPEGVLAAAGLACMGGQMEARLVLDSEEKIARAKKMNIKDPKKVFTLEEMASGDVVFAATGVTGGSLLPRARYLTDGQVGLSSMLLTRTGRHYSRHNLLLKELVGA